MLDTTFFESCGVADLIVTCYGGRNRRCAEEFVKAGGRKSFDQIEKELLNGQKLQGTLTVKEVVAILKKEGSIDKYPLFKSIYNISFEGAPAESMLATLGCFELEQVRTILGVLVAACGCWLLRAQVCSTAALTALISVSVDAIAGSNGQGPVWQSRDQENCGVLRTHGGSARRPVRSGER